MLLTSNSLEEKPEFRQEFRLGLVVYGGVSLAIYMNGVCREFYNAVRGRGIYKLIKALTDSDIIVDVISGTSAGGINGVLLSYALTNSNKEEVVDFDNFAQVWRNSGNINNLLHQADPLKTPQPSKGDVDSVLDGKGYYQQELFNAFQKAWQNKTSPTKNEWFSPSAELDLFVTGTDVLGKVYKTFDNTGRIIQVKDHRTVFLLKYRQGRKHPFEPESVTQKALAKLCRITSCFPVAFPVVSVKLDPKRVVNLARVPQDPNYQDHEADKKLAAWGQLENRELPRQEPIGGYQLHFVDGGVLDNRPFSYTIREIYYRIAYRPVSRKLFYIDPSPDRFLGSQTFNEMAKPSLLKVAQDSLIGMPRYESIANDLQEIKERNEKVRRYKFIFSTVEKAVEEQTEPVQPPASSEETYLRTRLVGLRDRVLPLILQIDINDSSDRELDKQKLLEKAARLLTQYATNQTERAERSALLNHLGRQIRNLDVEYALRKHFFLLSKVCQLMSAQPDETTSQQDKEYHALKTLAGSIGRQIELLEVIKAALEEMLQLDSVSTVFYLLFDQKKDENMIREQIYQYLLRLHRFLLDADGLEEFRPTSRESKQLEVIAANFFNPLHPPLSPRQISSVLAQLKQKVARLRDYDLLDLNHPASIWHQEKYTFEENSENDSDRYSSILRKVELASEELIKTSNLVSKDNLLSKFHKFRNIDLELYSYEYLADINEKESIKIYRISPDDAQRGFGEGKGLNDKLAGDQLRAFGGFFKKSWRSNDILWGRLDGLNRLVDALLTPESLKNFSGFLERLRASRGDGFEKETYISALVDDSLPSATPEEKNAIITYLMQLAEPDVDLDTSKWDAFLNHLITAGQRAIINHDLENVIADAIDEQLEWNQQQVQSQKNLQTLQYTPIDINPSSTIGQVDLLLRNLLNSEASVKVKAFLKQQAQDKKREVDQCLGPLTSEEEAICREREDQGKLPYEARYLDYLLGQSFPKLTSSDRQKLIQYPLKLARTAPTSSEDQYEFLNRLLIAAKREVFPPNLMKSTQRPMTDAVKAMESLIEQIEQVLEQLKPKYNPVSGYFDQTVNAFTAKELARTSVASLSSQGQEDYFRNLYRIGSEKLTNDVPSPVLNRLAARTGLILRNLILSSSVGDRFSRSPVYPFINTFLQLYYWLGQRKPFLIWVRIVLILAALGSVIYILVNLPIAALVAVVTLILLWLSSFLRR